ncbi:hypothetical protein TNCT_403401 [Trichonephila clavata]|uniref:Uncharacterized protein n=1 Tax=Trichonephila clavata TaxID=2740835 RepID=A0A8X6HEL7_TRICU|nr:hypothetical protein TNCT_403401 [Trichonephila clavata]
MHPSHNKQWFKTVHEYFRTLTKHRLPSTRRSLRPSSHLHSFRNEQRKVLFSPPPHRGFRFSSTRHVSLDYKHASNLSMDLLRHFKQWILSKQGNCPRTLIRKVLILKQAHSQDQVPRFDITGQPFRSHPAVPFIIQQVFLICTGQQRTFRITMQCFKPCTMELVSNSALSLLNNNNAQPVHGQQDTSYRKCIHPQQNSGLKLS